MASLLEVIEHKRKVLNHLKNLISNDRLKRANNDYHAKREPRDCGLTIHPGIGCVYECTYCYIKDMGFPFDKISPYPLTGLELAYAVSKNPNVALGKEGTYLAIGSITEPFHPAILNRTLEYFKAISTYLKNHTQVSTKAYISLKLAKDLRSLMPRLSVLVTIIDIDGRLEPKAPSPKLRFESIANLSKVGYRVALFLRPIIPGHSDRVLNELLELAKSYGAEGVVAGTLRVTKDILERLRDAGLDLSYIVSRLRRLPSGRKQIPIMISDLKDRVAKLCDRLGLNYYPTACAANASHYDEVCWDSCKFNRELCDELPNVDVDELRNSLRELIGVRELSISVEDWLIVIKSDTYIPKNYLYLIQAIYKRHVIAKTRGKVLSTM